MAAPSGAAIVVELCLNDIFDTLPLANYEKEIQTKLATTVYNTEEIELSDGSSVTLKPLTIKRLRQFMAKMKEWEKTVENVDENTEIRAVEILAQAAVICLSDQKPEWLEDPESSEDVLDMDTIFKIVEVCGGMKLNDPNLIQAAREAQIRAVAGTN